MEEPNCNGSVLRKSPQVLREILQNAVKEVAFGTSECVESPDPSNLDIFAKQEAMLQQELKNCMDKIIDDAWTNLKIAEKMTVIHQLEEWYPKNFVAWRPTAGNVPILPLNMEGLKEMEERLLYKISKNDAEITTLKADLDAKRTRIMGYFEKLKKAQDSVLFLHSNYERLLKSEMDLQSIANKKDNNGKGLETK